MDVEDDGPYCAICNSRGPTTVYKCPGCHRTNPKQAPPKKKEEPKQDDDDGFTLDLRNPCNEIMYDRENFPWRN